MGCQIYVAAEEPLLDEHILESKLMFFCMKYITIKKIKDIIHRKNDLTFPLITWLGFRYKTNFKF